MTGTLPTREHATDPGLDAAGVLARLRTTYATGRTRDLGWRRDQLRGIERMLAQQEDVFVSALDADLGRPRVDSFLADLAPSAGEAAYARRHLGRWVRSHRTTLPLSVLPGSARYQYEPLGVVLVVGPWNYPVYLTLARWWPRSPRELCSGQAVRARADHHRGAGRATAAVPGPRRGRGGHRWPRRDPGAVGSGLRPLLLHRQPGGRCPDHGRGGAAPGPSW